MKSPKDPAPAERDERDTLRADLLAAVRAAYDPEAFRAAGRQVVDRLADYLSRALAGEPPVMPPATPEEMAKAFPAAFGEDQRGELTALIARVLEASTHLHHPRYVGHQVPAPLPEAALCDLV